MPKAVKKFKYVIQEEIGKIRVDLDFDEEG